MARSLTQIRKTVVSSFDALSKAHKKGDKKAFKRHLKRFDKANKELKKRGAKLQTGSKSFLIKPRKRPSKRKGKPKPKSRNKVRTKAKGKGLTWREFNKMNMSKFMKSEGGHGPAMKRMGREWTAYKKKHGL